MTRTAPLALALALAGVAAPAAAGLNADICRQQAVRASGYSGPLLAMQVGRFKLRLSGSASVGFSYYSDPQRSNEFSPYAGQGALDRQEEMALDKYMRIYDDCMGNQ